MLSGVGIGAKQRKEGRRVGFDIFRTPAETKCADILTHPLARCLKNIPRDNCSSVTIYFKTLPRSEPARAD
eukprot:1148130-Pelagomonas_calceolata.AAC.2